MCEGTGELGKDCVLIAYISDGIASYGLLGAPTPPARLPTLALNDAPHCATTAAPSKILIILLVRKHDILL